MNLTPHSDACRQVLVDMSAGMGVELHVTTSQPIFLGGPYPPAGFRCPHGVRYWVEPTPEQVASWVEDGTP